MLLAEDVQATLAENVPDLREACEIITANKTTQFEKLRHLEKPTQNYEMHLVEMILEFLPCRGGRLG